MSSYNTYGFFSGLVQTRAIAVAQVTSLLANVASVAGPQIPIASMATPIEDATITDIIRLAVAGTVALPDAFSLTCVTPRYASLIAGM